MNRRQASLYLTSAPHIESLRLRYNPEQAKLIPPHVTLCREDEVSDWEAFRARVNARRPIELTLDFGVPIRDNDFVFLPVTRGVKQFHQLRSDLLMNEPRISTPHLTIIHPRNGKCTDEVFADLVRQAPPFGYSFREVSLIEQSTDGVWNLFSPAGAGCTKLENC